MLRGMNWLQRLVAAIVQAALDIVTALIKGIFRAPVTAAERLAVEIRAARPAEVIDLRHRVLRAGRPRATAIWAEDDAEGTRHWIAVRGDETVGVASVMARRPPDASTPEWQLRGMAVAESNRGLGIGLQLLRTVEQEAEGTLWCNARESAIGFYTRGGWAVVSDPFEVEGIGPHRRMRSASRPTDILC